MTLYINTKDQKIVSVALKKNGEVVRRLAKKHQFGSQVLLPLIIKLLKIEKIALDDLQNIEVETGPGSFTGLKVGVAVANALGFALNIPVNGKKTETDISY